MFWVYSMAVAIQNKNSFNPQARKLKSLQAIWDNDDQNKDRLISSGWEIDWVAKYSPGISRPQQETSQRATSIIE